MAVLERVCSVRVPELVLQSGFVAAPVERFLGTEGGGVYSASRGNLRLSAFLCAILNCATACEFVRADDDIPAVADSNGAERADPTSGLDNFPNHLPQPSLR